MTFRPSLAPRVATLALLPGLFATACTGASANDDTSSLDARIAAASELPQSRVRLAARDSAGAVSGADTLRALTRRPRRALSPLADSLADVTVFAPRTQTWFTAAARGKRMLVDIGRVDAEIKKHPERLEALREAAADRSTVPVGARLRLHGPWGTEEASVVSFDVWNGRLVGVVRGSKTLDSLARRVDPLPAAAELLPPRDSAAVTAPDSATQGTTQAATQTTTTPGADSVPPGTVIPDRCVRDSADSTLAARATVVRDSMDALLRQTAMPRFASQAKGVVVRSSQAVGCFVGGRRLALVVSLRSADNAYVQERVALLDAAGNATPVRVNDLRFKAHDLVYALDADGDGVDDLAAKAVNDGAGATVILRWDAKGSRFVRLTGGFAWERR